VKEPPNFVRKYYLIAVINLQIPMTKYLGFQYIITYGTVLFVRKYYLIAVINLQIPMTKYLGFQYIITYGTVLQSLVHK